MKLLHVNSSVMGTQSVSRQLTAEIVAKATPRNKRVTLRFWVSEARLCNSILDGMRRL